MSQPRSHCAITWLGHATVLLEIDGVYLLTDPVLRDRIGPLVRIAAPVSANAVGRVDAVLLSHIHADHADLPSLRLLARGVPVVAPRGAAQWLRQNGLPHVRELAAGESVVVNGLSVRATPAAHDPRRWPLGRRADPIGYLVEGGAVAYFAGDTDLFDEMTEMRERVDVALLPVWGWGRRLGPGHLNPERAARAAAIIAPRVAIPIHYGTFMLALPWQHPPDRRRPARKFIELSKRLAPAVEVRLLAPGERAEL